VDAGQEATTHRADNREEKEKVLLSPLSPDRKMVKYLEDLLRPHEYWDQKPTLKEGAEQEWGNIEGKR
jgi:hypothetical protein